MNAVNERAAAASAREASVSHAQVGPPSWARVASDTIPTVALVSEIPLLFSCPPDRARCCCGALPAAGRPEKIITCTLYTLTHAFKRQIKVLPCSVCRPELQRYAGPDLGDLGIFNYNNRSLYTHQLMNEYTSRYTTAETPFHAFTTAMRHTYLDCGSDIPFAHANTFRRAYFAFSRLQNLLDSFYCEQCGDEPDVVIADGCTAGFQKRKATSTPRPPTVVSDESPLRQGVKAMPNLMLVPGDLRRKALAAVKWRMTLKNGKTPLERVAVDDPEKAVDMDVDQAGTQKRRTAHEKKRDEEDNRMQASLTELTAQLGNIHYSLGILFGEHVAITRYETSTRHKPYLQLLEQVLHALFGVS